MENINLAELMLFLITFLFSLSFHEFAHGWVAHLRGDDTAKIMGRLTLNPIAHADIIGTIILPIIGWLSPVKFLIGWAKPVPVNPRNLKDPKNDMFWVALAGPAANVILAVVATLILALCTGVFGLIVKGALLRAFAQFIYFNFLLAVFNLIPLHPLDGGKIIGRFLPDSFNQMLEQYQMFIMVGLMASFYLGFGRILLVPAMWMAELMFQLAI